MHRSLLSFGCCSLTQLLAGGLSSPGARIDVAYDVEPFLRLGEGREVAHVKPEPLAAFLQPPAHEKRKLLEFRERCLPERHRRGGGAQVEDERTDPGTGSRVLASACDRPGREFCWCHRFPVAVFQAFARRTGFTTRNGSASVRAWRVRGSPAVIGNPIL